MVPVDGLTVIHAALPEAVQFFDTIEFLLKVTVCGGGVGVLLDALQLRVVGETDVANASEIILMKRNVESRDKKKMRPVLPTNCQDVWPPLVCDIVAS